MKKNKNPPQWVVDSFMESRQLYLPFTSLTFSDNNFKTNIYGKKTR